MPFTVKNWQDSPSTATPLSAAALEDLETRLGAYTDAQVATATGGGTTIVTGGGAGVGAVAPSELHRRLLLSIGMLDPAGAPAGDVFEVSLPDQMSGSANPTLGSTALGTVRVVQMVVPAGRTVHGVGWMTGSTGGTGANVAAAALYKASDRTLLAKSADVSGAWGSQTPRTFLMTTPWTATADTTVYAAVVVVGGTAPTLSGVTTTAQQHSLGTGPVQNGTADTGLASASAGLPATLAAVTGIANKPLVWLTSLDAAPAADVSEGLMVSKDIASLSATDATGKVLLTALSPIVVRAVEFVSVAAVSVSDTDWWNFELGRLRNPGNTYDIIATKTTKATGGAAVFSMTPYSFETVTFDPNNQVLLKDDSLVLRPTKNGAAGTINAPAVTVRYQVL